MRKNIIFMYSMYIFNMLFPMILMPLITNNITKDEYGYYSLAYTCFTFCFILCDFSFNLTEARTIHKKSKDEIDETINDVQLSRYVFAFISSILATVYFVSVESFSNGVFYFFVTFFGLVGYVSFASWYYVSMNDMKQNTLLFVIMKICSLISIVAYVELYGELNWKIVYLASVIYYPLIGFYITSRLKKDRGVKYNFSIVRVAKKIKRGGYLFMTDFAPNLYNTIPLILVSSYISIEKYAIFNLANRLSLVISGGVYVFLRAIYPSLCSKYNKNNAFKLILLFLFVIISGVAINYYFGESVIVSLFGEGYVGAYPYISVMLIGIIFLGVSESIQFAYLLPNNKDGFLAYASLFVVVISVIFLVFTFNTFKEWSLIYTVLLSRIMYMILYLGVYIRDNHQKKKTYA
ncbi:hypothetical protein ABT56_17260 [Photobacterium aquae]|uniref:Polysaccharide biosynthesis protein C-terminal domain-containing protein n=1 Tax=Photobacterium aquae TaxID=1195763 RepID=A0A0J1GWA2_9GAMM|nr:oligosaccharide flippase family protein [Photobacterium aquae]KLV03975.1 hypothetical protein ABT56_17260 [Photobacterium aquae]